MPLYLPRGLALAAALAWIGSFAAFSEHGHLYVLASTLLAIALIKVSGAKPACWILMFLPAAFFIQTELRKPSAEPLDLSRCMGSTAIFQAEILEIVEQPQFERTILIVRPFQLCFPREGPLTGKSEVIVKGSGQLKLSIGNYIEVKGRIIEPNEPKEPWRFKQKTRLAQNSIFCVAIAHSASITHLQKDPCKSGILNWISLSRQSITDLHLSTLGNTYGPLLESIVLGNKCVELPSDLVDKYRKVGLSHLLAASGFNLTIVIVVAHSTTKTLTRSTSIRSLSALVPMTIFVLLAGLSPSVVRAAACSLIILIAIQSGRSLCAAAVLSTVLIAVLAIEPISAIDVGAQLSYAATFGILYAARPLSDFLAMPIAKLKDKQPIRAKGNWTLSRLTSIKPAQIVFAFADGTVQAIAVVLSAQAAVLPIQLAYFWRLGTMFLPASVLVDPLVAPITVIGFVSSTLILAAPQLQGLCRQLDYLALVPLTALDSIANFFASIEGTYLNFGPPTPVCIVAYYAALVLLCASLIAHRFVVISALTLMATSFALLWRPALAEPVISVARNSLTFVGTDRKAIAIGDENPTNSKFLAYSGADLTQRICSTEIADRPSTFTIASGSQKLQFILIGANQMARLSYFPIPDCLAATQNRTQSSRVILAVFDENIMNAPTHSTVQNSSFRAHKKQSTISPTLLEKLGHRYTADCYLLIQRHFSKHRKRRREDPDASTSSLKFNQTEKSDLDVSLCCERGLQALLLKRRAEIAQTN